MPVSILLGRGQGLSEMPQATWEHYLSQVPAHGQSRLSFMTDDHHRIRYFVVKQLAYTQTPIEPEFISGRLSIPLERVKTILEELERKLFFLVMDENGAVTWAFPVTVETTPHQIEFSSGERLFGAWAEDVLATPFVQGQLRKEYVSIAVQTKCAHCAQALHFTLDSDMRFSVREPGASPLVFMPDIDWNTFTQRTILDSYWRNSIFFWSEEHAREYRKNTRQADGTYLTFEQMAYMIPITQGALFAFK